MVYLIDFTWIFCMYMSIYSYWVENADTLIHIFPLPPSPLTHLQTHGAGVVAVQNLGFWADMVGRCGGSFLLGFRFFGLLGNPGATYLFFVLGRVLGVYILYIYRYRFFFKITKTNNSASTTHHFFNGVLPLALE